MQLVLYMYQALCKPSVFEINGRQADYEDFGVQRDIDPDPENPYGCGDMTFTRYTVPMLGIKEKYNITDEELSESISSKKAILKELDKQCLVV